MLTCSNCGGAIREGAKFCTSCGTRLNDMVVPDVTNTWTTSAAPGADEMPVADTAEETATSSAESTATATAPASTTLDSRDAAPDDGFSWSWGSQTGNDNEPATTGGLDEESGTAPESERVDGSGEETEPIVDATEIQILEDDHTTSDEEDAVTAATDHPEDGDEDKSRDGSDTETLAAWAGQWDESADESLPIATTAAAETDDETASNHAGGHDESGDGEDTVAKAERLLGELRALMPALTAPRPAPPSIPEDASTVADDLESAASVGHFDDVRDTLLTARDNPRDVDNMMSLANKVDRLLELLDDRNNLAKAAESAASRLRSGHKPTLT